MNILERPLVEVGGVASLAAGVARATFLMHEGYDRPPMPIEFYTKVVAALEPGFYIVGGDRTNPSFSWPVYAAVG